LRWRATIAGMNEDLAWWFGDGDWYDRRLRGQIQELEESVSGAYAQQSRLRSQLATVQGNLQAKVDRMARAFDAFVELSDVRAELAVFTDAAIVRHQARLLLGAVAAGRTPVPPEPPAVPGYWLVPALRAAYARLTGDGTEAARQAEAATELDGDRARLFLAAATRLGGPADGPAAELAAVLPAGAGPLPWGRRMIWLSAGAGAFGPVGRELLVSALARSLADTFGPPPGPGLPPAADGHAAALDEWSATIRHNRTDPPGVATALADLRQRLTTIPTLAPTSPHGTEPTLAAVSDGGESGDGAAAGLGPLSDLVRALVDEGSAEEQELLRRSRELRSVIEGGAPQPAHQRWDEAVGTVADLVRSDLMAMPDSSDGTDGGAGGGAGVVEAARVVALRACQPWLRAAVDRAVTAVPVEEPPRSATVRIWDQDITVTGAGADPAALARVRAVVAAEYRPRRVTEIVGTVIGGLGLVLAVLGLVAGPALLALGILLLVAGVITVVAGLRRTAGTVRLRAEYLADVDQRLARAAEKLREQAARGADQRRGVEREHAALSELLG
jgi:hypothetical protein